MIRARALHQRIAAYTRLSARVSLQRLVSQTRRLSYNKLRDLLRSNHNTVSNSRVLARKIALQPPVQLAGDGLIGPIVRDFAAWRTTRLAPVTHKSADDAELSYAVDVSHDKSAALRNVSAPERVLSSRLRVTLNTAVAVPSTSALPRFSLLRQSFLQRANRVGAIDTRKGGDFLL